MNYQPFLDMHILLSDQLVLDFEKIKIDLFICFVALLIAYSLLTIAVYDTVRNILMMRAHRRVCPAHIKQGNN